MRRLRLVRALADVGEARADVDRWLHELGWRVSSDAPARAELTRALVALRRLGWDATDATIFGPYARAVDRLAAREVRRTTPSGASRTEIMERVVEGTVLFESALVALRRLAQEHHSAVRQA